MTTESNGLTLYLLTATAKASVPWPLHARSAITGKDRTDPQRQKKAPTIRRTGPLMTGVVTDACVIAPQCFQQRGLKYGQLHTRLIAQIRKTLPAEETQVPGKIE